MSLHVDCVSHEDAVKNFQRLPLQMAEEVIFWPSTVFSNKKASIQK